MSSADGNATREEADDSVYCIDCNSHCGPTNSVDDMNGAKICVDCLEEMVTPAVLHDSPCVFCDKQAELKELCVDGKSRSCICLSCYVYKNGHAPVKKSLLKLCKLYARCVENSFVNKPERDEFLCTIAQTQFPEVDVKTFLKILKSL